MESIPIELLKLILKNLPFKDVLPLRQVSSHLLKRIQAIDSKRFLRFKSQAEFRVAISSGQCPITILHDPLAHDMVSPKTNQQSPTVIEYSRIQARKKNASRGIERKCLISIGTKSILVEVKHKSMSVTYIVRSRIRIVMSDHEGIRKVTNEHRSFSFVTLREMRQDKSNPGQSPGKSSKSVADVIYQAWRNGDKVTRIVDGIVGQHYAPGRNYEWDESSHWQEYNQSPDNQIEFIGYEPGRVVLYQKQHVYEYIEFLLQRWESLYVNKSN